MKINVTWTNKNPNTVYNKLAEKLGRVPTNQEIRDELARIIQSSKP